MLRREHELRRGSSMVPDLARFLLAGVVREARPGSVVGTLLAVGYLARFLLQRGGGRGLARNLLRTGSPSPMHQKPLTAPEMARKLLCTLPKREPCKAISVPLGSGF